MTLLTQIPLEVRIRFTMRKRIFRDERRYRNALRGARARRRRSRQYDAIGEALKGHKEAGVNEVVYRSAIQSLGALIASDSH